MLFRMLTPKREAALLATSFTVVFFLGIASLIALCLAALMGLAMLALTFLESIAMICQAIGSTFHAGGPLVQLVMLLVMGAIIYCAGRPLYRRIVQ